MAHPKKIIFPLFLASVCVLFFLIARHQKPFPIEGNPAPEFKLHLFDGSQIDINDLKGKPVILYFFATW